MKKYYIVKRGRTPGVYYSWPDCQKEVAGFAGAVFKGFESREEAEAWYGKPVSPAPRKSAAGTAGKKKTASAGDASLILPLEEAEKKYGPHIRKNSILSDSDPWEEPVVIYTDGSCLINPNGPGGFAAVFPYEDTVLLAVTGGEPVSTNNRMELRAAYEALKYLGEESRSVELHTDSKYLQRAVTEGWLARWKRNGWKTASGTAVSNQDLWKALDRMLSRHHVTFQWVKGHAGTRYNEMCDQLAKQEASVFMK